MSHSRWEQPQKPKRPASRWERACFVVGRSLSGPIDFWHRHPLLMIGAVAMALIGTLPGKATAGMASAGLGKSFLWILCGLVVAVELFRGASRTVDWLFLPDRSEAAGGRKLNTPRASETRTRSAGYRVLDPNVVREISGRQRITELTGSLATAGLATAIVTAVLAYVTQFFGSTALIGQFAIGTLIGSWSLLTVSKLREGLPRERYLDRLLLAGVGVLVGVSLFELDRWLLIDLPFDGWSQTQSLLAMTSASVSDNPRYHLAESYVAYFATLFFFRRWWWHTDTLRPHRFRVLSVCLTAIVGAIAAMAWGFPVLWGTVWAASLSSVVQLAAVWTPREQRR